LAFQIKDFASITASMINHARGVTKRISDWLPGSVSRTLVEAPAVEIEELYLQIFTGLREAIPVAVFKSFKFENLPAKYARGFVTVQSQDALTEDKLILVDTEFRTDDGRVYLSTELKTIVAGQTTVVVPVSASASGSAYNASAGSINSCPSLGAGYLISNSAISTGSDVETDNEKEARFAEYVESLSRGTNAACLFAAKSAVISDDLGNALEYVTRTGSIETPGYLKIFIYSSAGVPSTGLISKAQSIINGSRDVDTQKIIPGYRSGGIRVDILPMVERAVSLSAQVEMLTGYELTGEVIQSLTDVYSTTLSNTNAGAVLYLGTLETELLSVTGLKKVVLGMDSNIICSPFEALKPGVISITELPI
jgi:hypothetical protein